MDKSCEVIDEMEEKNRRLISGMKIIQTELVSKIGSNKYAHGLLTPKEMSNNYIMTSSRAKFLYFKIRLFIIIMTKGKTKLVSENYQLKTMSKHLREIFAKKNDTEYALKVVKYIYQENRKSDPQNFINMLNCKNRQEGNLSWNASESENDPFDDPFNSVQTGSEFPPLDDGQSEETTFGETMTTDDGKTTENTEHLTETIPDAIDPFTDLPNEDLDTTNGDETTNSGTDQLSDFGAHAISNVLKENEPTSGTTETEISSDIQEKNLEKSDEVKHLFPSTSMMTKSLHNDNDVLDGTSFDSLNPTVGESALTETKSDGFGEQPNKFNDEMTTDITEDPFGDNISEGLTENADQNFGEIKKNSEPTTFEETKDDAFGETKNDVFGETKDDGFGETKDDAFGQTTNEKLEEVKNDRFEEAKDDVFEETKDSNIKNDVPLDSFTNESADKDGFGVTAEDVLGPKPNEFEKGTAVEVEDPFQDNSEDPFGMNVPETNKDTVAIEEEKKSFQVVEDDQFESLIENQKEDEPVPIETREFESEPGVGLAQTEAAKAAKKSIDGIRKSTTNDRKSIANLSDEIFGEPPKPTKEEEEEMEKAAEEEKKQALLEDKELNDFLSFPEDSEEKPGDQPKDETKKNDEEEDLFNLPPIENPEISDDPFASTDEEPTKDEPKETKKRPMIVQPENMDVGAISDEIFGDIKLSPAESSNEFANEFDRPSSPRKTEIIKNKPVQHTRIVRNKEANLPQIAKVIADNEVEDDEFVVKETADDNILMDDEFDNIKNDKDDEHGGLVTKIIQSKREIENTMVTGLSSRPSVVEDEFSKMETKRRHDLEEEISDMQNKIQSITKKVGPVGRILDSLMEDMDLMMRERNEWSNDFIKVRRQYHMQKTNLEDQLLPLQKQEKEIEQQIEDIYEKITSIKSQILQNEKRIETLIINVSSHATLLRSYKYACLQRMLEKLKGIHDVNAMCQKEDNWAETIISKLKGDADDEFI
ncbi:hypothetical protein SNEBB_007935 [Seison nebaliae]|nr:hypothetical protein SNEBB_007935 [Seison nebaliae]